MLGELENMSDEIAAWRTTLPERSGYGITQAFRQCCERGVRYGYMTRNPCAGGTCRCGYAGFGCLYSMRWN